MTRIDFHLNVADHLQYTCRLVRKAFQNNTRIVCYSTHTETLNTLNQLLWTFSPTDFLPHTQHGEDTLPQSPIILTHSADDLHHHELLINLDTHWPPFFARFDRLIEIVSPEEEHKAQARERYRFYKERGYPLHTHNLDSNSKGKS